jgi:hypothetical protein
MDRDRNQRRAIFLAASRSETSVFVGTDDARMLRVEADGYATPVDGF